MTLNALTTIVQLKDFLAGSQGMVAVSDFDVEKDPRTGQIPLNPARTLAIQETEDAPSDALFEVRYDGCWH
ncbi:MAG: hypothetical protein ACQ9IQ_09190 [Nitrospirales bacterium]